MKVSAMSEAQADTIVILSSELIAKITQEYFNKTMFKQKVEIVDLKPHGESGYAFSIAFITKSTAEDKLLATYRAHESQQFTDVLVKNGDNRDQKGRFVKHG